MFFSNPCIFTARLLLAFGDEKVEIPSIDLIFAYPRQLLGDEVEIYQVAFVYAAESMGGQALFILPQKKVFRVITRGGMDDAAPS